ncbi:glycosyltransferase [Synechococcus sp. AH-601-B19]|nr:glycosyltransferase [Synechococcus sp. AH-601-B19]
MVVHFYYHDACPLIEQKLQSIPSGVGLFITCPSDKLEISARLVSKSFPHARLIGSKNVGMDILPFLSVIPILENEGYEIVFKLQTKKGQNDLGVLWRDVLLDSLIGDGDNFLRVADSMLSDESIVISGPACFYMSAGRQMMQNKNNLQCVAEILDINNEIFDKDWGFFSGSMFCALVSALSELSQKFHVNSGIHGGEYRLDGNIEHALERFFGLLPRMSNGAIGLLFPSMFGFQDSYMIKTCEQDMISYAPNMSFILSLIRDISIHSASLSEAFDYDYYGTLQRLINKTRICKIRHFLFCGLFAGLAPCPGMDIDKFWKAYFYQKSEKIFTAPPRGIGDALVQFSNDSKIQDRITQLLSNANNYEVIIDFYDRFTLFDHSYYCQQIGNNTLSRKESIQHYLEIGLFRDYFPFDGFIPAHYLSKNRNIYESFVDPFFHYCSVGALKGLLHSDNAENLHYLKYLVLNKVLIDWNHLQDREWISDKVSVVIPIYNNFELTKNCLESLYSCKYNLSFEVICVDNGSDHDVSLKLQDFCRGFKDLILIANEDNLNFALGCNIGFSYATNDVVVFLNNDTLVEDYWLDKLYAHLKSNPQAVAVQPRLLYEDKSIQCIGVVFADKQVIGYPLYQGIQPDNPLYSTRHDKFKAITAACIAIRSKDFARLVGFDCHYINGQEDIDLCLRLCEDLDGYCSVVHDCNIMHLE